MSAVALKKFGVLIHFCQELVTDMLLYCCIKVPIQILIYKDSPIQVQTFLMKLLV